jgi:GTPase SAR1 family protein
MVGLQGAGKSTLVAALLAEDHVVVSKDHWPNARRREARQLRAIEENLLAGRAVFVHTPFEVCEQRNLARQGRARVPDVGLHAVARILQPPTVEEGFIRVERVPDGGHSHAPGHSTTPQGPSPAEGNGP